MLRVLAVALIAAATPADARCFSRWYYPWKQNCGVKVAIRVPEKPKLIFEKPMDLPDIIVPLSLEEEGARQKLKALLNGSQD
jgi:hypothetical protein